MGPSSALALVAGVALASVPVAAPWPVINAATISVAAKAAPIPVNAAK
jgi:hypothetical protein